MAGAITKQNVVGTISGVAAVYQRHEFLGERKEALTMVAGPAWSKTGACARDVRPIAVPGGPAAIRPFGVLWLRRP